ncbi:phytanoyl-CoA dioxygenase family protein [Alteromonas sp. AMM-1]|uniref:phytanoyl-CoA dioxygenase family protein n=1 Tax=Alteromonas sp. AMM-1 TaxID=3394233 RepID=UPI0039A546C3
MENKHHSVSPDYQRQGFVVLKGFLGEQERARLLAVVNDFHQQWLIKNSEFYAERAINSAYLTASTYLNDTQRQVLFNFIGSHRVMALAYALLGEQPAFMNTQLFFDPAHPNQKNYWHRDAQYHLSLDEQRAALAGPQVLHFRFALVDEPGLDVIPASHINWDTVEELDVRMGNNGKAPHHDLSNQHRVPLKAGDLMIFSANLIHRGIYGMDRRALDVLFCDPEPGILKYANPDCLPNAEQKLQIKDPTAFSITQSFLN